jgi:hypothetical protein
VEDNGLSYCPGEVVALYQELWELATDSRLDHPGSLVVFHDLATALNEIADSFEDLDEDAALGGVPFPPPARVRFRAAVSAITDRLLTAERLPHLRAAALATASQEVAATSSVEVRHYAIHLPAHLARRVGYGLAPMLLRQHRCAGDLAPIGVVTLPRWCSFWLLRCDERRYLRWEDLGEGSESQQVLDLTATLWEPNNPRSPHHRAVRALSTARALCS